MGVQKTAEKVPGFSCSVEHEDRLQGPKDSRDVRPFTINSVKERNAQPKEAVSDAKDASAKEVHGDSSSRETEEEEAASSSEESVEEKKAVEGDIISMQNVAIGGFASSDLSGAGLEVQASGIITSSSVQSAADVTSMQWVNDLIEGMVVSLTYGETIDGAMFASMDLVKDVNGSIVGATVDNVGSVVLPEAFQGAKVILEQSGEELKVSFSNFETIEQSEQAIVLMESGKPQLASLVVSLKARNISLQEVRVGSHIVQLPRVEEPSSPMSLMSSSLKNSNEEGNDQNGEQQQHNGEAETIEEIN